MSSPYTYVLITAFSSRCHPEVSRTNVLDTPSNSELRHGIYYKPDLI